MCSYKKNNILLIEDDVIFGDACCSVLRILGYNISFFNDGYKALEYYHREWFSIDLIILDFLLPHVNNHEILSRIYNINPHAKILITSGYELEDIQKQFEADIAGFIAKPFGLRALKEAILKALADS